MDDTNNSLDNKVQVSIKHGEDFTRFYSIFFHFIPFHFTQLIWFTTLVVHVS